MVQTEIISSEELKRYLGLLYNMEIFGMESGRYTCIGAFDDERDEGIGVLVAELLSDSVHIKRIYVKTEYRRQGIAKKLLQIVTDVPDELKQPIVTYGVEEELDKDFLGAVGFSETESEFSYLEGSIKDFRMLPSPKKNDEYSVSTVDLVPENALKNYIHEKVPELFAGDEHISDGSLACRKGREISAVILIEETHPHTMIPLIFGRDNMAVMYCFSALREELLAENGPDARIRFLMNKDRGREAVEKIVANTVEKKIHIYEL